MTIQKRSLLLVPALLLTSLALPRPSEASGCGNLVCETNETCSNCPYDCAPCPVCGNTSCELGENCSSCPDDCDPCPCGNGVCGEEETCETCAADCGPCQPSCNPPQACQPVCGNFVCEIGETCQSCNKDCGACPSEPPPIGCILDDHCSVFEDCTTCADDCCPLFGGVSYEPCDGPHNCAQGFRCEAANGGPFWDQWGRCVEDPWYWLNQ